MIIVLPQSLKTFEKSTQIVGMSQNQFFESTSKSSRENMNDIPWDINLKKQQRAEC